MGKVQVRDGQGTGKGWVRDKTGRDGELGKKAFFMFYENQSIIIHQILADRIFNLSISLLSWSLVLLGCCSGWFYIGAI